MDTIRDEFVGRNDALSAFYIRFAYRHMKNGVYFYGNGGLGKTWILKRIVLDFQDDPTRTDTEIIDFANTQNQSLLGLQASIQDCIGDGEAFHSYNGIIQRIEVLSEEDASEHANLIASLEARANREFVRACDRATSGGEIVLLFDTFERVQERYVGKWLVRKFLPRVGNLIVAIAGRPIPVLPKSIPAHMPDNVMMHELSGLELKDVGVLIARRWPTASQETVQVIWRKTNGQPLLIHLILDLPATSRDQFITELKELPPDEFLRNKPDLQRRLVGQFALPRPRNLLIWSMAYFKRRFDLKMLKFLLDEVPTWFRDADYAVILEDFRQNPYIKIGLESETHLLHDEIQHMIAEFILKADNTWDELHELFYDLIVDKYYPQEIKLATPELAQQLRAERLGYLLDEQPQRRLEEYISLRIEIEQETQDYDFEELVWGEMRDNLDHFHDKAWDISVKRGKWLRKHSRFDKAEEHFEQMLSMFPENQAETYGLLGFVLMKQGRFTTAEYKLIASRDLIEESNFRELAEIDNVLGQNARMRGKWDQALEYYARSLRYATLAMSSPNMASAYLNRAYIYSLKGFYAEAKEQCKKAIDLIEGLPEDEQIMQQNIQRSIYAWMNLGTSLRHSGDFDAATEVYLESLNIAKRNKNPEAECDVLQNIGINTHLAGRAIRRDLLHQTLPGQTTTEELASRQDKLDSSCSLQLQAWHSITQALAIAYSTDWRSAIADGLHRLAHVYREVDRLERIITKDMPELKNPEVLRALKKEANRYQIPLEVEYENEFLTENKFSELNWFQKAIRLFDLSALMATETDNYHRALDSLTELSRSFVELNVPDKVSTTLGRIVLLKGYDYQEQLFTAMVDIGRADIYFLQRRFDSALEKYATAYVELARRTGLARFILLGRLRDLEWRIRDLPPDMGLMWCDLLENHWLDKGVAVIRPEMLDSLELLRLEALDRKTKVN